MIKGISIKHYRDENTGSYFLVDPQKFTLWVFLVSVVMMFAAFTSAYIVRKAEGNWLEFDLPSAMQISTLLVVFSSICMVGAQLTIRKSSVSTISRISLALSLILGLAFIWSQVMAWQALNDAGVFFVGNPSGSFVYVISGLHGLHILGGIIFLLVALISPTPKRIGLAATYWHFVGILWVYLYFFLNLV